MAIGAVTTACGGGAPPEPTVVEEPVSGTALDGAWEQVAGGSRFCLVFCPGDKMLIGSPGCGDEGAGNFVPGTFTSSGDSLEMSGQGATTSATVVFADPNNMTMTDSAGARMQFERAELTMSVCDASWDVNDQGPAHHSDRDADGFSDAEDQCPDEAEDVDSYKDADGCPDPDNDNDGIPDHLDQCKTIAEDLDGVEDDDGCPEKEGRAHDRDGDGISDVDDLCPDDPEDRDMWGDDDGCPDIDNDLDRILDVDDMCPNNPEDMDGFRDMDGCPDLDNDGDGFPDVGDACPNAAETMNGKDDADGCPD
jgi:hypothetical protein